MPTDKFAYLNKFNEKLDQVWTTDLDLNDIKPIHFSSYPEFTPNLTPSQVIQLGSFGGGYFRPIFSDVLNKTLVTDYKRFNFLNKFDKKLYLNKDYQKNINYHKVICGTTLAYWQVKKWIKPCNPRGWFEWYCDFYEGKRGEDDSRQIKRWLKIAGSKGRQFRKFNKGPACLQTLIHWAVFVKN